MRFRYTLTHNETTQVVVPSGAITIDSKRESEDIGASFYRKELSEFSVARTKDPDGYDFLLAIENSADRCVPVVITVEQIISNGYHERYVGEFTMNDCEFNLNQCIITVKPRPRDRYSCLLKNSGVKVNVMQAPNKVVTNASTYVVSYDNFLLTLTYNGAVPDPLVTLDATSIPWLELDNTTVDGNVVTLWGIFQTYTECLSGEGVTPTISGPTWKQYTECANGIALWIAEIDFDQSTYQTLFATNTTVEQDCQQQIGLLLTMTDTEIGIPGADGTCYSVIADDINQTQIPNGVKLSEMLSYVCSEICPDITAVVSDFFQINPENVSTDNYVTGEANPWIDPNIHQISDVLNPDADQAATRGEVTFRQLMEDLFKMFRVKWYVDDSTQLRIEHESWFETGTPEDLSSNPDKVYSYNKEELSGIQRFRAMSDVQFNIDFVGRDIEYDKDCTSAEVEEIRLQIFCSDYDYIQLNPGGNIPTTGFVIFSVDPSTDDVLWQIGVLTNTYQVNAAMGWSYLHDKLHRHNRNQLTGTMNGEETTFESAVRLKKQTINTRDCNFEIDPSNGVTTKLGTGIVESMSTDLSNGWTEIEILL